MGVNTAQMCDSRERPAHPPSVQSGVDTGLSRRRSPVQIRYGGPSAEKPHTMGTEQKWSMYWPVTSEVAGSSPVVPAITWRST